MEETTSSFPKIEISKLRPAKVFRKSHLFHICGLSGSPFHHVYHIDSDFKRIFPDLKHDVETFFNKSRDERLCVDIKSAKTDFYFEVRHRKGETNVLFLWGANYHFDTAEFSS